MHAVFVECAFFIEHLASAPVMRTVVCAFAETPVEIVFSAAAMAVRVLGDERYIVPPNAKKDWCSCTLDEFARDSLTVARLTDKRLHPFSLERALEQ